MVEHALARGASEAVMPNTAGMLCEGTGSNIFYVIGEQLITPTLEAGPLAGVTRALVLEWCAGELDPPAELAVLERRQGLVEPAHGVEHVPVDGEVGGGGVGEALWGVLQP